MMLACGNSTSIKQNTLRLTSSLFSVIHNDEAIIHIIKIPQGIYNELDTIDSSWKQSKINSGLDHDIRSSKITFVPESNMAYKFCRHWVNVINEDNFKFDLHPFFENKSIQYSHYNVGDHYCWHIDTIGYNPPRKLSFTLMLNDDYDGGEFEIGRYSFGDHELKTETITAENKTGTLIVFPSALPHRVKPVLNGIRKSLVGWIPGPPLR